MANTDLKNNMLRLHKYQSLIIDPKDHDKPEQEWHRRLENFLKQQVYMSPVNSFNDPFEGKFILTSNIQRVLSNQELFNFHHQLFQKEAKQPINADEFRKIISSPDFQDQYYKSQALVHDFFSSFGALCLTPSSSNIPMWAHYSNEHRGYCVVFELDLTKLCALSTFKPSQINNYPSSVRKGEEITMHDHSNNLSFFFTKVEYSPVVPTVDIDDFFLMNIDQYRSYDPHKKFIQGTIGTKFNTWSYEDEYRLMANLHSTPDDLMSLKLTPFLKVTGIIMGAKVAELEKSIFHQLCKQYRSSLYQATTSKTAYKIDVELIKDYSMKATT